MNKRGFIDAETAAHVLPLGVFLLMLSVPDLLGLGADRAAPDAAWYVARPEHWLFPLQTIVCFALLVVFRRYYQFTPHTGWLLAAAAGAAAIVLWIAPGYLFESVQLGEGWWKYLGLAPRVDGFDPTFIKESSETWYVAAVAMRMLRLVVLVPLVEEIFWRGFLMRYLVDPDGDFWKVPFGTFDRRSLVLVTAMFVIIHAPVDYLAAAIYGLLAYWIAVRTKSLSACVVMHATANLLLGIYILTTERWGYW
ncbi:MAG: CAAX prenyl protease-related protein [Fuerstiella sp.]